MVRLLLEQSNRVLKSKSSSIRRPWKPQKSKSLKRMRSMRSTKLMTEETTIKTKTKRVSWWARKYLADLIVHCHNVGRVASASGDVIVSKCILTQMGHSPVGKTDRMGTPHKLTPNTRQSRLPASLFSAKAHKAPQVRSLVWAGDDLI